MASGAATVLDPDQMPPDLAASDPIFARLFDDPRAHALWFWFWRVAPTTAGSRAVGAQLRDAGGGDMVAVAERIAREDG
jgi:hypothetical protein